MEVPNSKQVNQEVEEGIPTECCYDQHNLPIKQLLALKAMTSCPSAKRRHSNSSQDKGAESDELDELINELSEWGG